MVRLGTWIVYEIEPGVEKRIRSSHFVAARNAAIAKELVAQKRGISEAFLFPVCVRMDSTPMSNHYWTKNQRSLETYVGPSEQFGTIPKVTCKGCGGSGRNRNSDNRVTSCESCRGTGLQRLR